MSYKEWYVAILILLKVKDHISYLTADISTSPNIYLAHST